MGWTNRGLRRFYGAIYRAETIPTNFYISLVTAANVPDFDTVFLSELTEIAAGNGYTAGGISLTRNTTDFPTISEDDTKGRATVTIKDLTVTASGGTVPASGDRPRYAVLHDGDTDPEIWAFWDIGFEDYAPSGATIPINDLSLFISSNGNATNRGLYEYLDWIFRGTVLPTYFYLALVTAATSPSATTNTMADLTEITAGNGYTAGGYQLNRDGTDFPTLTESTVNDTLTLTIKDVIWTASGGNIPSGGSGASFLVLTTDEGTISNRTVIAWWDVLGAPKTVSDGTQLGVTGMYLLGEMP